MNASSYEKPWLYIFAGANGSGKTTMAEYFMTLPGSDIKEFVNADEIAKGLSPFNPEGSRVRAGKLAKQRIDELISKKLSFAIETTLAGHGHKRIIQTAKQSGFEIFLIYCYSENVAVNIKRIENRVIQGGHNVPEQDITRRYERSLRNLMNDYIHICDFVSVYDTTPMEISNAMNIYDKINGLTEKINSPNLWKTIESYKDET